MLVYKAVPTVAVLAVRDTRHGFGRYFQGHDGRVGAAGHSARGTTAPRGKRSSKGWMRRRVAFCCRWPQGFPSGPVGVEHLPGHAMEVAQFGAVAETKSAEQGALVTRLAG